MSLHLLDPSQTVPVIAQLPRRNAQSAKHIDVYVLSDSQIHGIPPLELWELGAYGKVLALTGSPWLVTFEPNTHKFIALNIENSHAFYFPGQDSPPREMAEFCRPLLHWCAILDGNVIVHAAAIGWENSAVLVCGEGNSGKTTLSRVCLNAGMTFLGDNVVEVSFSTTTSTLHGIYPSFKVRPSNTLPINPLWPAPEWDTEAEKDIYFLSDVVDSGFNSDAVQHMATLCLSPHRENTVVTISMSEAFFAIAPNTVAQFPYFEKEVLERVSELTRRTPLFSAGYLDLHSAPERLKEMMSSHV